MNTEKCVVLVSGGLDSTTLLHHVVKNLQYAPENVVALSIYYGQRHIKEVQAAAEQCQLLGVKEHQKIKLEPMMFGTSGLMNKETPLPSGHYTDASQKITVVPNRNMVFLSIAAAVAESIGAKKVFYGAHSNDRAIYPDCRPEFIEAVSKASALGTYGQVTIEAPFVDKKKADIVKIGLDMSIDYKQTWTCYEGRDKPCGKCASCQERIEAFKVNGAEDPLMIVNGNGKDIWREPIISFKKKV